MGKIALDAGPRKRLVARLDVKAPNLVKGVQFEGLRVVGNPNEFAIKYADAGADELFLDDIVASLFGRNSLYEIVADITSEVFVPVTVGGGIRSPQDVEKILRHGGDKVSLNTGAVQNPALVTEVSKQFGSQCAVISIQAKWNSSMNSWEVMTESGREKSGLEVITWAKAVQDLGAGEILLTSVDRDGTRRGFDERLCSEVCEAVSIPVVVGGGYGKKSDLSSLVSRVPLSGVAVGSALHSGLVSVGDLKKLLETDSQTTSVSQD